MTVQHAVKEDIELFMEFCERNKKKKAEMEHDD